MSVQFSSLVPIFRIFDEDKAREFYLDFLGGEIIFEHRFAKDMPLYMGITLGGYEIHLSEHHGSVCPGGHIRIKTDDVNAYARELAAKGYNFANPGGSDEETPWGTYEMTITDPFGNNLTFWNDA